MFSAKQGRQEEVTSRAPAYYIDPPLERSASFEVAPHGGLGPSDQDPSSVAREEKGVKMIDEVEKEMQ
jgi:hypothetical protein